MTTPRPLIPCISMPQPWATLVACGLKTHRRMRRNSSLRGPLAVYAEAEWRPQAALSLADPAFRAALTATGHEPVYDWIRGRWECPGLPRRCVLGSVELAAVTPVGPDWAGERPSRRAATLADLLMDDRRGEWVWEFCRATPLGTPVPCRGAHGLFLAALDPSYRPPQDRPPPRARLHAPGVTENRPPRPVPPWKRRLLEGAKKERERERSQRRS